MEIKDIMTRQVVSIDPAESVEVAARTMTHYNIGALPVCANGRLCGMVSLGDLAIREQTSIEAGDALGEISDSVSRRAEFR